MNSLDMANSILIPDLDSSDCIPQRINEITIYQRPYIRTILSKLAEVNKNIAQTIYDYIIKEQNTFNIKESTKEGKIKLLVWLSNHFQDEKKFIDYEKQSWISQLLIFNQILKEYNVTNNIGSSEFPKNVQSICNRLRKAKTPLLEGLGIEIKVDRITSGI